MQEALDRMFGALIETDSFEASERRRMDQMRPLGRELYKTAAGMVRAQGGRQENMLDNTKGVVGTKLVTAPVTRTFQHSFAGKAGEDENLDIEVQIHLERHNTDMRVVILAEFPRIVGAYQLFAFAENGDTINHWGRFVSAEEMSQATDVLANLGSKVPQLSS